MYIYKAHISYLILKLKALLKVSLCETLLNSLATVCSPFISFFLKCIFFDVKLFLLVIHYSKLQMQLSYIEKNIEALMLSSEMGDIAEVGTP